LYNPKKEGTWKIKLQLNRNELKSIKTLEVNGREEKLVIKKDTIIFEGISKPNTPLRWTIKY